MHEPKKNPAKKPKLTLNRETLRTLEEDRMLEGVVGGIQASRAYDCASISCMGNCEP